MIVAIRPLAAPSQAILVALNEGRTVPAGRTGLAMEFIIREDGGRTISVVQAGADGFRPGARVALTGGARSRMVARAASST